MTSFKDDLITAKPEITNLPITFSSFHIWQTMAIAGEAIAVEVLRVRAQEVADAVLAHATHGVAPESSLAVLAVSSLGVEEAFEAVSGVGVAVSGVVVVPVVTAVAGDAGATGNFRISMIVVRAYGTTESCKN